MKTNKQKWNTFNVKAILKAKQKNKSNNKNKEQIKQPEKKEMQKWKTRQGKENG